MPNRFRPHYSTSQRAQFVAEFKGSGLSQREFAAEIGVCVATLHNWLRKDALGKSAGFVELPPVKPAYPNRGAYKLNFPGGLMLELPAGFEAKEAGELLRLIKAL